MRRLFQFVRAGAQRVGLAFFGAPGFAPVYMGDHTLLAKTAYGDFIYLDSRDVSLTPSILSHGFWEPMVARTFERFVRPGMNVVDVGANCGFFALLSARLTHPSGKVVAIDANPRMADLLARSVAANGLVGRVRPVLGAVSDQEGEIELGFPDSYMGSTSMLIAQAGRTEKITTVKAIARPLHGWLDGLDRIDVLKIDVEGAEPLVWAGAQSVVAGTRPLTVFMEFAPPMLRHFRDPADFLREIRAAGFSIDEIVSEREIASRSIDDLINRDWAELILRRA
jgi:FkbM family methyltransferase